jgi:D-alanyl-D-alanine carboxypeptidase/D-alanyl-D-alanine-endopeptidase (penicillin-binding protein 4)
MRFFILLFGLACLVNQSYAAPLPRAVLNALLDAEIPLSAVGIEVRAVNARLPLLSINAQLPMNPASTMKLLTTYAGLEILGPAYRFKTEAYTNGQLKDGVLDGDLVLKGYGDPQLTLEQFWLWLRELRGRGLREIRGNLLLDRSAFLLSPYDPATFDHDPARPYNVTPDAFLLNFNTVHLRFMPGEGKVRIYAEPELANITLENQLAVTELGDCANWDEEIDIQMVGNSLLVQGTFPASCGERSENVSVLAHSDYLNAVFRALWKELGGTLRGELFEGVVPRSATLFSTHNSIPLSESIRSINKFSNNVMARQLFLSLGMNYSAPPPAMNAPEEISLPITTQAQADEPGIEQEPVPAEILAETPTLGSALAELSSEPPADTITLSEQVLRDWLKQKNLIYPELVLENGAGLSRTERISAHSMAMLLQAAQQGPLQPEFESSMPILSVDGTLRKRLNGSAASGKAHLKTGTLADTKTIAGYIQSRSGKKWILVFFINHPHAAAGLQAQDALIEWVQQQR